MKKTLLFIYFLSFIHNAFPIYFKHLGMREGLSQISIMSVYQDELGKMWFGTEEGVSVYDGEHIEVFKYNEDILNSLPIGNENFPIVGDQNGNIYFRSDRLLIHYDIKQQQFKCLKKENVTTVYCHNQTVWVGASDSVYIWDPKKENFRFVLKFDEPEVYIQRLFVDSEKRLWLGTTKGLFVANNDSQPTCVIPSEDIYELMEDSQSNLWIATKTNGMYKRDQTGLITKFTHDPANSNTISSNHIRCFTEDNFGNIWIGTFTGLNKYNPRINQFTVYRKDDLPGSLKHSSVFSICKDRQGTMWVGTYYGGVHYFNPETDIFTYYSENSTRKDCLSYFFVGHMVEDKDQNIWICTEGGGLNFFDRKNKTFKHYLADASKHNAIIHNNLKSISYSGKRDKLYIGTHIGGLSIFDIKRGEFRNLQTEKTSCHLMIGDAITQVEIYNNEYLIILSRNGFFKLNLDTEEITPLFEDQGIYGNNFLIDSKGYIWISAQNNIFKINLKDKTDQTILKKNETGWGVFNVSKIYEDRKGRIFLGTNGSGLYYYDEAKEAFTGYTTYNNLLQSNYCYDIVQSTKGHILVSGDKGLSFLDPDRKILKTVNLQTALPISGINTGCGMLVCQNGEIFVGGIDGLTSFFEQELFAPSKEYNLYFSTLYVNNERVYPNSSMQVLKQSLPYTRRIVLNHKQNNLIFSFTSNNYINTLKKTDYEYQLEGYDNKWISNEGGNISYTNLSPGNYSLIVREKQSDPEIQAQMIEMNITIKSPFYATPLFYFLYLVTGVGLLYGFLRFRHSRILLQTSLELERKDKEHIEELNQAKLQFFANISHEFRTPLTLIISQIELLLQNNLVAPFIYNKLLKIQRNTYHMRNLISELLDFRKLEQKYVQLKVKEQDIIPFLKEIHLAFYEYASTHSITYRFTAPEKEILCWFDAKQMQKVFYNLLSNAFKYTEPQATIEMIIEDDDDSIAIKVIDNGIGITKEDIGKIFDRFYQAGNVASKISQSPSTGIGLSMVKSIIELHHGSIQVESTPGYGSIFIIYLQKGKDHFSEQECTLDESQKKTSANDLIPAPVMNTIYRDHKEEPAEKPQRDTWHTLLLVEDNEELLQILNELFSPIYHVITAQNGKEGLEKARKEKPDLIVSDIMMPEMSGTEMCLKIKNDFDLCHIPVVLLTALSSIEQNIEGLQQGADDYINKPFNEKTLVARCNNLIRSRIILQKKFSRQIDFDTQSLANNPIDQGFLNQVNTIIEQNFDNTQFDIHMLARELGLSRSSLYTKFKALTGMNPNDFVLNRKLKQAALLLKTNVHIQVTEISDQLGFSSSRYFSRCFKSQFNMSPTEYRKKEADKFINP